MTDAVPLMIKCARLYDTINVYFLQIKFLFWVGEYLDVMCVISELTQLKRGDFIRHYYNDLIGSV